MKTPVSFTVTYNPSLINKMGALMSKLDLGVSGINFPQTEKVSWTTTTKVDKKYLTMMKSKVKEAYERQGNTVIKIV